MCIRRTNTSDHYIIALKLLAFKHLVFFFFNFPLKQEPFLFPFVVSSMLSSNITNNFDTCGGSSSFTTTTTTTSMMNSSSSTQSSPSFNEKSPSSLLPHLDHTDIGINHNKTIRAFNANNTHSSSLVNHNNIPPQHLHNQLLHYQQQQQQRGVGSSSPDCEGGGGDISDGNSDPGSGVNSGINTGGYLGLSLIHI